MIGIVVGRFMESALGQDVPTRDSGATYQLEVAPSLNTIALSLQAVAKAHCVEVEAQHAAKPADVVNISPLGQYMGIANVSVSPAHLRRRTCKCIVLIIEG